MPRPTLRRVRWWLTGIVLALCGGILPSAHARDLNASLPYLPSVLETSERGAFIDLVKAIDDVYTEGRIVIKIYPFQRSLYNVVSGNADFHLPMFKNPAIPPEQLPFRHISVPMGNVVLVLYSHIDHPLTKEDLLKAKFISPYPYVIETDRGLVESLNEIPIQGQSSVKQMFQKLDAKRIDGFIFAQEDTDAVLKELRLKSIQRTFYLELGDFILVQKSDRGDEVDRILSQALRILQSQGRLQPLHQKIHRPYQDWQPADMGW